MRFLVVPFVIFVSIVAEPQISFKLMECPRNQYKVDFSWSDPKEKYL